MSTATMAVCALAATAALAQTDEWVIGHSANLTGAFGGWGAPMADGAKACFKEAERKGRVAGYQLRWVLLDDKSDAEQARANAQVFANKHKARVLFNPGFTPTSLAVLEVGAAEGITVFAPASGAGPVQQRRPTVLPLRASYAAEARHLARHMTTVGQMRVILPHLGNPGAMSALNSTLEELRKRGASPMALPVDEKAPVAQEMARLAAQVRDQKPQAVVLVLSSQHAAEFLRHYRGAVPTAATAIYSFSFLSSETLRSLAGRGALGVMLTQVVPNPADTTRPIVAEYARAMKAAGLSTLGHASLEGYISCRALIKILALAAPRRGETFSAAVTRAGVREVDLGGMKIDLDPAVHQDTAFVELNMITERGLSR